MTVFVLLFLPVLLRLGVWQLERADEKRALVEQATRQATALPGPLAAAKRLDPVADAFRTVTAVGRLVPERYFLLDNQLRDGVVGYWVLQLMESDRGRRWLVNRGFLPAAMDRSRWPLVPTPAEPLSVRGMLWPQLGLLPLLDQDAAVETASGVEGAWPRRVQRIDLLAFAEQLGGLEPLELRLSADSQGLVGPAARAELPQDVARHQGYAVQWFALAGVLTVGWILFGRSRARERGDLRHPGSAGA